MSEHGTHQPVLLREAIELLAPKSGQTFVDATVGLGGHAEAMLERVGPAGRVVGIDRDPAALERTVRRLSDYGESFIGIRGDHRELNRIVASLGLDQVDGVLFDLGVSSLQLDDPERGFSFSVDGPLDMRMDPSAGCSAADWLAETSEEELRRILWRYGEERHARVIARAVLREQAARPILRTGELARLVERTVRGFYERSRIHPATRTFQALRIAVNEEVDGLERTVTDAVSLLHPGGRTAVISFHSLEDRAVKHTLRDLARSCTCPPDMPVCGCGGQSRIRVLTRKPLRPTAEEIARNNRARSAKLRAAEKL